jgi:hypothetical protein
MRWGGGSWFLVFGFFYSGKWIGSKGGVAGFAIGNRPICGTIFVWIEDRV